MGRTEQLILADWETRRLPLTGGGEQTRGGAFTWSTNTLLTTGTPSGNIHVAYHLLLAFPGLSSGRWKPGRRARRAIRLILHVPQFSFPTVGWHKATLYLPRRRSALYLHHCTSHARTLTRDSAAQNNHGASSRLSPVQLPICGSSLTELRKINIQFVMRILECFLFGGMTGRH